MSKTVTVTRQGKLGRDRFQVAFSALPGRTFGPWDFARTVQDLTVSALLSPLDARDLVMEAGALGHAIGPVNY